MSESTKRSPPKQKQAKRRGRAPAKAAHNVQPAKPAKAVRGRARTFKNAPPLSIMATFQLLEMEQEKRLTFHAGLMATAPADDVARVLLEDSESRMRALADDALALALKISADQEQLRTRRVILLALMGLRDDAEAFLAGARRVEDFLAIAGSVDRARGLLDFETPLADESMIDLERLQRVIKDVERAATHADKQAATPRARARHFVDDVLSSIPGLQKWMRALQSRAESTVEVPEK